MPVPGLDYMGIPAQAHGPTALKWDPKNLEIRTTSVERTLEPLVIQVAPFLAASECVEESC